ncbi:amidohydrolase family protein [Shimia sagamensis]|uniref:L-fuconolactonase n=1 Tax=Shimia sagamensis TaxID=1566352 RepID=A0ABY1NSL9_9RHOB|nr:amidohydrolase family protein [Shimia sagamensis]SMP16205.1 L-fuconolactonase [Shimia sagamensis]
MKIDAHQHFWKLARGDYSWLTPDLQPLYRDFGPKDLRPLLETAGVDGTIAVQAADTEAETEYLLALADEHDWIFGVVGWTDLEAADAPEKIERMAQHPKLVGFRPMIQDIKDDAWMLKDNLRPALEAMALHNLTFDALVMPRHLGHLLTFLEKNPNLRIVIDHGAKPAIRDGHFDTWATDMTRIAQSSEVFCKLSGLTTEAGPEWALDDLSPYIERVLQAFTPARILFGSDWPVLNLASSYGAWLAIVQNAVKGHCRDIFESSVQKAYPRLKLVAQRKL